MTPKDGIVFDGLPVGLRGGTFQNPTRGEYVWQPSAAPIVTDIELGDFDDEDAPTLNAR
jgi:hypothetical protein